MNLTPHAREALALAILKDLRVSQTTASSTAGRLKTDIEITTQLLDLLVRDGLAETDTVAQTLTVYRITPQGLELLS
jgi:DNA-binding PadR family transcriptional regulator